MRPPTNPSFSRRRQNRGMRLKVFRAADVPAALAAARAALGADALVLSTRRTGGVVEVTAALEEEQEPPAPLEHVTQGQFLAAPSLGWHGVPLPIAERLRRGDLSRELGRLMTFGALPVGAEAPPLALVGVPGAGKTLTLAKLATRLVLSGAVPLVITADGRRAGAAEELAAYTRLLGLSLVMANHPATLVRALTHRQAGMPVIIDTAGVNPFDVGQMENLAGLLSAAGAVPVLVAAAGTDALEAAEQAAQFRAIGARHLLVTRLDVARRLGCIPAVAVAGSLCVTEAASGTAATGSLAPLTPQALAERLATVPPPVTAIRGAENATG